MSASTLLFLSATTSLMSEPTNGRARDVGTGVTRPIHKLERFGVNTAVVKRGSVAVLINVKSESVYEALHHGIGWSCTGHRL